jgi:hypothetical protein
MSLLSRVLLHWELVCPVTLAAKVKFLPVAILRSYRGEIFALLKNNPVGLDKSDFVLSITNSNSVVIRA